MRFTNIIIRSNINIRRRTVTYIYIFFVFRFNSRTRVSLHLCVIIKKKNRNSFRACTQAASECQVLRTTKKAKKKKKKSDSDSPSTCLNRCLHTTGIWIGNINYFYMYISGVPIATVSRKCAIIYCVYLYGLSDSLYYFCGAHFSLYLYRSKLIRNRTPKWLYPGVLDKCISYHCSWNCNSSNEYSVSANGNTKNKFHITINSIWWGWESII